MSDRDLWRLGRGLYPALDGAPDDLHADLTHMLMLGPAEVGMAAFLRHLIAEEQA